jgi:TonB family protein
MVDGKPVVVAGSLEVGIQSCVLKSTGNAGKKNYSLRLRSVPVQRFEARQQPPEETTLTTEAASWKTSGNVYKVGDGVSDPVVLNRVETEFTDAARNAQYQGQCLLTAIVDEQGMPEDLEVLKPLDYGLTENAVAAASKYRFKPAMKDGKPVAVKITIEVNFKRT